MISFGIGFTILMAGSLLAQCSGAPQLHERLQWSKPATIVSPNRAWQVEVHPVLSSDENETPVSLHGCQKKGSWPLFTLQRSAEMYWSRDSQKILIINEPVSGSDKLLFFSVKSLSPGKHVQVSNELNNVVKQVLFQRLGEKKRIEFFLPAFVSWKRNNLLLAVGGAVSSGGNGSMTPYCYGIVVNSSTLQVEDSLLAKELKEKFGAECRVSP